jgi:flavin reductase (DIM6/NTAB) family NADH-FMN oxidoreductase RutF
MIIDPRQTTYQENYKLMVGSIVPRPIAFVSTVSADGELNLAPFSYFTAATSAPPTVCFSPGYRPKGPEHKDTLANIEATGEFVVNIVTEALGPAMNETAGDFPATTNEFDIAGLTPEPSKIVKPPRVKESPINMECKVYDVIHIGPKRAGGGALVIGEVVMFHVHDEFYDDGRIKIHDLKPLGRLAGSEYTTLGKTIELKRTIPESNK